MEKINVKISDMFSQHCVKTRIDALTVIENVQRMKRGFEIVKKSRPLSLSLIGGILIVLFSIIGCSDVPYTGQVITVGHVDQYLDTIEKDTVCLQDGFDSVCIKLMLDEVEVDRTSGYGAPIVHVHPTSLTYVFYYEGTPILRAKRGMDTSDLVQQLRDTGRVQLPPDINDLGNSSAQGNDFEGWIIEMYHPNSFPETNRGLTLRNSGLDIRAVEGMRMLPNNQRDLQVQNFTQTDGLNGSRGVQFSIETKAPNITIQVGGLVPGNTAKFHISANGVESDEETNILQLQPL